MILRLAFLLACLAGPLCATPTDEARAALRALDGAVAALEAARSGGDRIAALSQTVRAFEDGLAAVREGQRAAAREEVRVRRGLAAKEAEIAQLVGVLQVMGQRPAAQLLLHPEGPTGAARSGMLLAEVTPALQREVAALRAELAAVRTLRQLQEDATTRLREGLIGVEDARSALAQAIADRTELPKRFVTDPIQLAVLIAASETLDGFAAGLSTIAIDETEIDLPGADDLRGTLAPPVRATILRRFGEADAAGVARPGIILATRPFALVTAPASGTVRFEGALLDYGNVMILEPARDVLVVLAGLSEIYVTTGDVVTTGAPIGLMGAAKETSSTERTETLYIEVRDNQEKADPETWFAFEPVREKD